MRLSPLEVHPKRCVPSGMAALICPDGLHSPQQGHPQGIHEPVWGYFPSKPKRDIVEELASGLSWLHHILATHVIADRKEKQVSLDGVGVG